MRKLKLFTFLLALVASVGMSWATSQPIGYVDVCTAHPGSIHLVGWANDPDALDTSLPIHVYVDQPNGGDSYINEHGYNLGTTDVWREDGVNPQYTGYHKIDRYIDIMEASGAGTYRIRSYALNAVGNDGNLLMRHSYLGGMPITATLTVPAPYSITYNANGGNGAPAADYKCYGIDKTLSSTVPTRTGYTFNGWNTEQNGSGTSYAKGATYSANASATLYAKWNLVNYSISYTLNGGSVTGNPTSYNVTTNTFTLNNPQKTGYTFAGWTGSNGNSPQATGSINKGSTTGDKTYTANWTPINYTITYDLAGGTATNPASYNVETNTFTLTNPTRSGYIFTGWTGSNGNTPQTSVSIAKGSTGDKSYTANWRSEKQTGSWTYVAYKTGRTNTPNNNSQAISYNGFNGKLGSWGNVSFINAGDKGIGCQATGKGRANEKKGIYSIYKNEQTIPSYAKRRLTATLTVSSSCAKYNTTAALYAHTNQTELQAWNVDFTHGMANSTGSSKRITYLVNSTKNGSWQSQSANYTFDFDNSNGSADATKGWYILLTEVICTYTAYDSGVSEKAVFNSSDENFDTWFYYKHVTFNGNGATSGMMDLQKVENSASLTANGFVRTGYTFVGWNTAADGTGTAYDDEGTMTATATDKGPVTLYAQWMPNNYTVTLDQQSGTGGSASVQATYAAAMPSATMPTREGHTFCGYYTAVHGGGTQYYHADGTSAKNFDHTDDMTLHALWTVNQYTITFNTDGGSLEEPITQDYGSAITVPNAPMRTGYIFTGWQPEIPTTMPAHDMTVVAQWTESTEPVTKTIYSGFTATDGSGGFDGEERSKLVDGLFTPGLEGINWTKWCTRDDMKSVPTGESEACWWVDFHSATPITVTGYILTTGNDNVAHGAGRNPNTWVLQAKLHPSDSWKSIAAVTNDTKMQVADFTDFAFDLDMPGTYKYFRYKVLAPKDGNLMQLCELRLTKHSTYNPEATTDEILAELYEALGNDVWTGYGEQTGVISYSRGSAENTFGASFMGGTYSFDLPFEAFTAANKHDNGDGTFTYNLSVNLPALTGMSHETLQVTMDSNGNITGIHSDNAAIEMTQESGVGSWAQLQAAMAAGGVIKLTQHVTAPVNATALYVPTDKTVMLDLNDFTIDRALTSAVVNGSVIINDGTLAIMGEGQITGGNTTGNGGGILNNGTLTLYGGTITGNHAHIGAGVYNNKVNTATEGFWMTGGLIHNNTADTYPAIKGDVAFNNMALVQIDADGTTVSVATAKTGMSHYGYVKPVMPDGSLFAILSELYAILGNDVWTGYGAQTGVISYSRGEKENEFRASFMGGTYAFDLPFTDFTAASKTENTDGSVTYNLTVLLPPQAGMPQETLEVTIKDGEIKAIHSDNAQIDMVKAGGEITSWDELRAAMAEGGVIKLSQSITAPENAEALMVPTDKTVVLDLNGFTVDRALTSAVENGSVIINEGVLAIVDELGTGVITGGNTTENGGGILNNGTLTLYGGTITGNHAHVGAGVYNNKVNTATEGFWMTGGLIHNNTADTYPAIKGDVAFNAMAVVQINESGTVISAETAKAGLATNGYIRPVMPNGEMLAILSELYNALGTDVWTGYGEQTGVISYSRVEGVNEFHASFMGGTYAFDLPFGDFTAASKTDNADGSVTYNLTVLLPAQTGMPQETLEVTIKDGEIKAIHSDNAGVEMMKEGGAITSWEELQAAMNAGGVIKLTQDITATANAEALNVPLDKTVVLDLNGFAVNRALTSAVVNGSVIINDGTLAIMDETGHGTITGGNTTGNGGGILNNGTLTLYGGEITGNKAANGGAVYNNGGEQGFWMTGGLIDGNAATTYPSISGEVIFNSMAVVETAANGATVSISTAKSHMGSLTYVKPVMPNMNMFAILAELYAALGDDVWTGYGANTGVISYSHGIEPNTFRASFMGGTYAFDLPFGDFSAAEKVDNGDGTYTYNLTALLPVETGMSSETLHVTVNSNGEITGIHSDNAQIDMVKEGGEITSWEELQAAMNAGGVITLTQDITAPANAEALTVPAGKTVVIELDGNTIDRALTSAVENGSVIINNGVLAIMDETGHGTITGGNTTGNGGGILNNGTFTLYSGEITGNTAVEGGGVYNSVANTETTGFWMTGGLIANNTASSNPAIGGAVIFNEMAAVQIDADGTQVTIAQALVNMASYNYVKPVMPSYDELETDYTLLLELYNALGNDVWTGYGVNTGVISYSQGTEPNSFNASFMGGTYSFDLPFEAFTSVSKADNGDGTHTYTLVVNLPAQTGMGSETLHVTMNANGEITEMDSENAGVELQKETDGTIATWADLQNALNNGGVIKLTNDIVGGDAPLEIPAGKTVVLDLNGHTIDRGMSDAEANGSVIVNNGTLAIVDNSELANGVITGGKTTGNGGGVLNNGIFTLYGGEITGNHADEIGGGVYNNGGEQGFWMTGGLIKGNTATTSNPAIGGEVIFNAQAVVQINADGDKVSIAEAIAGLSTYGYIQPVMPDYDDYTTEVAIVANEDPNNANVYYSTFFDSANKYLLPAGVEAYVADLSGNDLLLTKIAGAGQVLPANVAVIFKASVQNFNLIPSFEVPVSFTANNDLEGVDAITAVTSIDGLTTTNCYVLSGTDQYGVGFYRINSENLKAHKAYVKYTGSQTNAPKRMRFVFNQEQVATGIDNANADIKAEKRIENGQLFIIRNGVKYNVNGQIVR